MKYISTAASTFILQSLNQNRGVIITGSPGCGKSIAVHHVALTFEKEGYEIIPCDGPSDILKHFTAEKIQVFVIDDICGKFALNQHKADSWEQHDGKLNMILSSNIKNDDNEDSLNKSKAKFIITCRENIYNHKAFPKLTCFSLVQCSFSTKYKISPDEMRNIALSYLPENTVNGIQNICLYDFFPLLCALYCKKNKPDPSFFNHPVEIIEKEISEMKNKSETSFLCLSLLVLKNNKFCKDELISSGLEQLVKAVCRDSEIESYVSIVSIQKCLERLKGIYITESENLYAAIHDKMFDIISAAIAPSIINCLIEYVDIAFIANRIQLSSCGPKSLPFVVYIPPKLEGSYLKRQYNEAVKGNNWEVFGSIQTENQKYRKLLISFLKEQDKRQEITYVPDKDEATPMFVSSYLGYIDFVEYFKVKSPGHIGVKDKEGRSSFFVACENGHISVVKYLMKCHYDINTGNAEKTTALSATCLNGHTEVAQLLLNNNADINKTNNLNQSTLHFACLNGNMKLVQLLLYGEYNVDITITDNLRNTALHIACDKGHSDIVKTLVQFGMDVNQKQKHGKTPLYIACTNGYFEIVKYITDYIYLKQKHRTVADELKNKHTRKSGWTVLHSACNNGHTEVVKLLVDVGMTVNDLTTKGFTPLFLACQKGHNDTAKCLLDLKSQTLNKCVDTKTQFGNGWTILHKACSKGLTDVVKLLIVIGMNVNDAVNAGITPFYLACQNGHHATVKFLLDLNGQTITNCVNMTVKNEHGWSVLHAACYSGRTEVVKLLIDVGVDVNDTSKDGATPLHLACHYGHYEIVKLFLDLNGQRLNSCVDTNIKDEDGWSVLHIACSEGHSEIVKLLITTGMNINDISTNGYTPLQLACQEGNFATVKFLLDLNGQTLKSFVNMTLKDEDGWSILHAACHSARTEVVKLLIDVGMNVNDTSKDGSTPLLLACRYGHYETVKLFLDLNGHRLNSCVDTNVKDKDGLSVLHVACSKGLPEIVKLLIDNGLNINEKSTTGSTPLYLACREGHNDIVKLLLDLNGQILNSRVDMTLRGENGWSVLHTACANGHTEVVKLLIEVGMNVNDSLHDCCTPLYLACQAGHNDTVKLLLKINSLTLNSGVDTTIKDKNGSSVLHTACSNGYAEVVKLLIDVGMNVNDTTNNGCTPLLLACQNGHYDTVKLLLDSNGKTLNSRVDTTLKDEDGNSALNAAFSAGNTQIVKLLSDVGTEMTNKMQVVQQYK